MKKLHYSIVIFLLVITIVGCTTRQKIDRKFVGTQWQLMQLNEQALTQTLDKPIIVEITDEGIKGYGGCNYFGSHGAFFMNANKFFIESIESSAKSCGTRIDKQETELYRALKAVKTYKLNGNHLELYDDMGKLVMLFERVSDE